MSAKYQCYLLGFADQLAGTAALRITDNSGQNLLSYTLGRAHASDGQRNGTVADFLLKEVALLKMLASFEEVQS